MTFFLTSAMIFKLAKWNADYTDASQRGFIRIEPRENLPQISQMTADKRLIRTDR